MIHFFFFFFLRVLQKWSNDGRSGIRLLIIVKYEYTMQKTKVTKGYWCPIGHLSSLINPFMSGGIFYNSLDRSISNRKQSSRNFFYWCRTAVRQTVIFCRTDKYLQDWKHICCQNIIFFAKIHRTFIRQAKYFCWTKWKKCQFCQAVLHFSRRLRKVSG